MIEMQGHDTWLEALELAVTFCSNRMMDSWRIIDREYTCELTICQRKLPFLASMTFATIRILAAYIDEAKNLDQYRVGLDLAVKGAEVTSCGVQCTRTPESLDNVAIWHRTRKCLYDYVCSHDDHLRGPFLVSFLVTIRLLCES